MNAMEFGADDRPGHEPRARRCSPAPAKPRSCSGVDAEVGTLEAGKVADIVAVPGNVLNDIHATEHPLFVMHLGKVVAAEGRQLSAARNQAFEARRAGSVHCAARRLPPFPAAGRRFRGVAQPGRALRSGRRCRRFKSCHPDH